MKIISSGSKYEIYSDDLRTHDKLPVGTYKVSFHPFQGFSLHLTDDFVPPTDKIYGNHMQKIQKVMTSYAAMTRSLGIILSGNKGMGKSLFVRLLSGYANDQGLPVIIVNRPFKGLADYIDSIDQEVLVIFDEFEKVFSVEGNDGSEGQHDLLGLFDGTSNNKRMYAITVNNLHHLSDFMLNRTGRFHYHIRFDYPTPSEITTYLTDMLDPKYYDQIDSVLNFSKRVSLNYDTLRAIAFELNMGYDFADSISDLNILNTDPIRYDVTVGFSDGTTHRMQNQYIDLFQESVSLSEYVRNDFVAFEFPTTSLAYTDHGISVDPNQIIYTPDEDATYYDDSIKITSVTISPLVQQTVHYKFPSRV